MRAVVFDLWDTLVAWPVAEADVLRQRTATLVGIGEDELGRRWRETYRLSQTGPLAAAYRAIGIPGEHIEARVAEQHEFARRVLRPRAGCRGRSARATPAGREAGRAFELLGGRARRVAGE